MEDLRLWAPIVIAVLAFGWNIRIWIAGARKEELTKLDARIDEVEALLEEHRRDGSFSRSQIAERLTLIEGRLEHMPDLQSSQNMQLALARVEGRLDVLSERLIPVSSIAERLQEFLLEQAKR